MGPLLLLAGVAAVVFFALRKSIPSYVQAERGIQYIVDDGVVGRVLEKTLPMYHSLGSKEVLFKDGSSMVIITSSINEKPAYSHTLQEAVALASKVDPVLMKISDVERIVSGDAPIELDVYVVARGHEQDFAQSGGDFVVVDDRE